MKNKRLVVTVCTMLLCLAGVGATFAQTRGASFNASGQSAAGFTCGTSQNTNYCISVSVHTNGVGSAAATFMFYDDYAYDIDNPDNFVDYNGNGQIPNSAFQVKGNVATLNVDTSKVAGFQNFYSNITSAGPSSGGLVSGTWTLAAPRIGSRGTFTTTQTFPSFKVLSVGNGDFYPTFTTISVLGTSASNVTGNLGTERSVNITITR